MCVFIGWVDMRKANKVHRYDDVVKTKLESEIERENAKRTRLAGQAVID
jgi:hypothetical protein